jgi:hypothetical protein
MSDMKSLAQNLEQTVGRTAGGKEIVNAIEQKQRKRALERGLVPITTKGVTPSPKTIWNYTAVLASDPEISVIRKAIPKTQTRYTAENSWMSSVCFMILVAATHYIPMTTQTNLYEEQQKKLKDASPGAKKLFSLVLKANMDWPILALNPAYIFSTDDTTTYVCLGEERTKVDILPALFLMMP